MFSSIKDSLDTHPIANVFASLFGYIISLSDFIPPVLRFLILFFTSTAISVAYIQFIKARRLWYGEDSSKKDDSNTR